jgi:transcription antitermination factor NusG
MDDNDINKIKEACGLLEKEHVEFNGEIGDAVMIIDGPFLNYTGEVQSIKNGKAKVNLIDEESVELGMTVEIETAYLEVI